MYQAAQISLYHNRTPAVTEAYAKFDNNCINLLKNRCLICGMCFYNNYANR